jgi:PDZ domain-containing protein
VAGWSEKTSTSTARIAATTTARLTINPDTTDEIVLAGPDDGGGGEADGWTRPPPPRKRRWWLVPLILLGVIAVAAAFVRLPYDTIAPGNSRQVNDVVLVKGGPSFPPKGQILETTVSVRERVTPYEILFGWLSPDIEVLSEKKVRGNTPPKQYQQQNVEAMADSKTTAEILALRQIGLTDLGVGAEVVEVQAGQPAASILKANDVIVAVDGKPVKSVDDLLNEVESHAPGESVTVTVLRGGREVEVPVTLGQS